jgi:hypothetical protein
MKRLYDKVANCICSGSQSEGRWRRGSFGWTVLSVLLLVGPVSSAPAQAGTPLSGDSGGNVGCIPCDGLVVRFIILFTYHAIPRSNFFQRKTTGAAFISAMP